MDKEKIRSFCILAHIDHGKSTLADRLLEKVGTIPPRAMREQVLDNMELEREKGVTIKLKTVRMRYESYILNLIDTPGHVDFGYEVSRSLAACEGALLLVDASQGIQAQTISNFEKAKKQGLVFIPLVNKIDLAGAEVEKVAKEMVDTFNFSPDEVLFVSAKEGVGTERVLAAIIKRVPPPKGNPEAPFRALIFDSKYDEHKGVIALVRIVDGSLTMKQFNNEAIRLKFIASEAECKPLEVGCFTPDMTPSDGLYTGEVGYIATGFKDTHKVRVGDTVTKLKVGEEVESLPGYKEPKRVVFAGLFPSNPGNFQNLRKALEKLSLSDSSFTFKEESSPLGRGFACGFLGVFHAEIIRERLKREYGLRLLITVPSVEYQLTVGSQQLTVRGAEDFPDHFSEVKEPWTKVIIYTPKQYLGDILKLVIGKRGIYVERKHLGEKIKLILKLPLSELIVEFYDRLKSISKGFASLDWEFLDYRSADVVRLDILIHGEKFKPLSQVVLRSKAQKEGKKVVKRLKEILPRAQFPVALQAAVGGKILARETIPALAKNVTAKLYGGDRTRKSKLLQKQKKGKAKLKKFGKVRIPPEAFKALL